MYTSIPPTIQEYSVPVKVLKETRRFLYERGCKGFEGVVLWLGRVCSEVHAEVLGAYIPRQVAYRTAQGLAVEIPEEERLHLAINLPRGVFVLVKVHSHAERAYHSTQDDSNPFTNHQGAISIVVPFFSRSEVLDLTACSVNRFHLERGWEELTTFQVQRMFSITGR